MAAPFGAHHYLGEFADDTAANSFLTANGLGSPVAGLLYYNTASSVFKLHNGTVWVALVLTTDPRIGTGTSVSGPIEATMSGANIAYKKTTATTYETIQDIIFSGTTLLGTPLFARAVCHRSGSSTMSVRLLDITNSLVIAELTGITATVPTIVSLGTLSNLPTGYAIFSIQIKTDGGGTQARISTLLMEF